MDKKIIAGGALVAVLVVAGVAFSPNQGTQGNIFKQSQKNVVEVKKDTKNVNKFQPKEEAKINFNLNLQDNLDIELEGMAMNQDGVVYFDGECAPYRSQEETVVLEKGANAEAYNTWVQSMNAELRSNSRERNGEVEFRPVCPYLVEVFETVDSPEPMLSFMCDSNVDSKTMVDETSFSCRNMGFTHKFDLTNDRFSNLAQKIEGLRLFNNTVTNWTGSGSSEMESHDLPIQVTRKSTQYTLND